MAELTVFERLFAAGQAILGKAVKVIGGQDPDGLAQAVRLDSCNSIRTAHHGIQAAAGALSNESTVNKFGRNVAVTAAEDIISMGGNWNLPTAAVIHNIASDDPADNGVTPGIGMRTAQVWGIDENWNLATEVKILNGVTDVPTSNKYLSIFRMRGLTAGSSRKNVGLITATAVGGGGLVTAEMPIGKSTTLMAVYSVPVGFSLFVPHFYSDQLTGFGALQSCDMELLEISGADTAEPIDITRHEWTTSSTVKPSDDHTFDPPKSFSEMSHVKLRCAGVSGGSANLAAGFDGYLRRN